MLWNTVKALLRGTTKSTATTLAVQAKDLLHQKYFEEAKAVLMDHLEARGELTALELALLGEVEFHLNQPSSAESLFFRAIKMQPGLAEGHYGLSLIYYEADRHKDALTQALYARNRDPASPRILAQLGLCHISLGDYGPAREVLRQAVLLDPKNVPALNNFSIALHAMGEISDSWYYLNRALSINPEYQPAKDNLSKLFTPQLFESNYDPLSGNFDTSLPISDLIKDWATNLSNDADDGEALEVRFEETPEDPDIAVKLIKYYLRSLRLEDVADILNTSLAHNPDNVDLSIISGQLAEKLGQFNRAQKNYEKALSIEPNNIKALLGLGHMLKQLGKPEDALVPVQKAADIDKTPNTLLHLAFTQCTACHYEESLLTCDTVESTAPFLARYLTTTKAVCHAYLGHFEQALSYADSAEDSDGNNPGFNVFKGMLDLLRENYREGWAGYSYRYFLTTTMKRLLPYPRWSGEDLTGKTILVLAEQGLGDQVMFASCLPDLKALKPATILLEANRRVEKTLARSFPDITVTPSDQKGFDWLSEATQPDYYIPIADLPRHFRNEVDEFPSHTGYLIADQNRVDFWNEKLSQVSSKPVVGISWRGGLQITRQSERTLSLQQLKAILSNQQIQFVNLQYGDVCDELNSFTSQSGLTILNYPEAIKDLDEFSALISALDLVITVCNTTVHYTGALGKPGWVLAPYIPEWRYGINTDTMRWYPSIKMFRQHAASNWTHVLKSVEKELHDWINLNTKN